MRTFFLLLVMLAIANSSSAQSHPRPEILVLGTFHMANPGHDIYSSHADDVLSPNRQREIGELVEVLKRFHPTKIAIEADAGSRRVTQEYSDYVAGKYTLSRNEIDQIGYRLARELGLSSVYPVDADGDFPMLRLVNYVKANNLKARFDSIGARTAARVKAQDDFLASHSILETLGYMNSDSLVATDVAEYFEYVKFGEPWEYAGSELLASWYQRNIRIYHNIVALIGSPNERILVIFGNGHLGWLRQDAQNDASVRLRKLSEFTPEK